MPVRASRLLAALAATAGLSALPARADLHYGFDTDAQGWTAINGGDLVHQASGGNGGGFLQVTDISGDDFLLVLPAAAAGNWSGFLGGTLSFDARNLNGDTPDWAGFGEITFTSGNVSVTVDGVSTASPPAGGGWATYTVPLTTSVFGDSLPAFLGNLSVLTIKGEFHAGVTEVVGIDNIHIAAAVPEPGVWALMLGGGLLIAHRAQRSRRR